MKRLAFLGLMAMAGCADPHQPLSEDFGNAVNTNIAAQVVNPVPADGPAETDGRRTSQAIGRYRDDQVRQPHLPLEGGHIYSSGVDAPPMMPPPSH
jgi:hypothetical protein